jgi:hypothetical protein
LWIVEFATRCDQESCCGRAVDAKARHKTIRIEEDVCRSVIREAIAVCITREYRREIIALIWQNSQNAKPRPGCNVPAIFPTVVAVHHQASAGQTPLADVNRQSLMQLRQQFNASPEPFE